MAQTTTPKILVVLAEMHEDYADGAPAGLRAYLDLLPGVAHATDRAIAKEFFLLLTCASPGQKCDAEVALVDKEGTDDHSYDEGNEDRGHEEMLFGDC